MTSRVVIVGTGVISRLGNSLESTISSMLNGDTPRATVCALPTDTELLRPESLSLKYWNRLGFAHQMAFHVIESAIAEYKIPRDLLSETSFLIGPSYPTTMNYRLAEDGKRMSATRAVTMTPNSVPGYLSIGYTSREVAFTSACACATGAMNIALAKQMLEHGTGPQMIVAGGVESCANEHLVNMFSAMKALSETGRSLPFASDRDGFVLSEGAACLVMTTEKFAREKGLTILAVLSGVGMSSDATDMVNPNVLGQMLAISKSLDNAGIEPDKIDYINAHATGTPIGDQKEAETLVSLFEKVPNVCANKTYTGHMLGASSAFEAAMSVYSVWQGVELPNSHESSMHSLNFSPFSNAPHQYVLSNSFGFGGTNVSLVFGNVHTLAS